MTEAAQYLLVVYMAERTDEAPLAPTRIAEAVGRSPAATTEMLQRLDERGLVEYEPYEGARLTDDGNAVATDIHERYVTLSTFFREVLDLEDPEAEAMELAGTVSTLVTERLASVLLGDAEAPASLDGLAADGD